MQINTAKPKLKKIVSLFIFTVLIGSACKAQYQKPLSYGSKKAFNYCNLIVEGAENSRPITGFAIGFFGNLSFSHNFSFQSELYYTTKGAQVTYNDSIVKGTADFHLNYLEMPLLLVLNISKYFNIHAGPYIAIMLNSSVKNISDTINYDFEKNAVAQNYRDVETGVAAGTGTKIGIFGFGVRYNYGFTGIAVEENSATNESFVPVAHNSVINIYLNLAVSELRRNKNQTEFGY